MSYSLTNPQNSIWLTEKFFKGTSVNNICGYVYIKDEVNFDVLKKALNELVKTNDSMRFKFKEENSSCIQYVTEYKEFDIDIVELNSEKEIEKTAMDFANIPIDIENSLLFKIILFKLPKNHGGFIINVHHIIGDSWTLGLVAKETTGIYSDLLNSTYEEKNFPSYINYINNEKEYINSEKYIKDKAYWDEVFKTVPEVASIPSMKSSKNTAHSCKGAREKFIIPKKQINEIKEFCTKNKISVYNFFMAVYSLYLGRVSNLDDFIIGTPILNRTNFEQKHTMGMFISTAPLRINLDHSLSFTDFTKQISSNSMSLLRHQRYPYQAMLEDLRKKDASIPNLYNVILSYQITKTVEEENNIKYTTDWVFNGNCADELQIHLFDLHGEDSITVAYDYKTEKYDSQDINDLHARILTVINQVIDNNDILLKNIDIVTPEEKHKILYEFNNTKVDYPRDKTIVDLFEEQVEKTPDNIAVVFEDQKLTYRELNEKANQLAHHLVANNVKVGDVVAILLDKSLEMIISILGVLKSGAAFLPIDISYPNERIDYIINNSKSNIVLTSKNIVYEISHNAHSIFVDNNSCFSQYNNANLNTNYDVNNLAYVMYTSGSTGNPKGVMVTHQNIVRLVKNNKFIDFEENEHILQTGSIVFDACTFEIWSALLNGFKLFIMKKDDLLDAYLLENYLKKNKITTLWLTAPLFNQLCEVNPYMFKTVKKLLTGGDVLSPKHVNLVRKNNPDLKIINGYGPTENTTFSCCFTIDKKYTTSIPIGKPISNSTAYVVSNSELLCPIGVSGELWVGGDGVSKGYLNNDDLTKEKFIKNPFGNDIIYKTGDLVKWLPDGNIEFIGRIDNQVKIRGFRIELSEIDTNILTYTNIKHSISIIENINNTKTICSYVVSDKNIDINKLKAYLSKTLANYMIPTYITQLDNLPLNINGKVDRKQLPLPNINETAKNIVAARNNIDKTIIDILKNILSTNTVSIEDNLFTIGMDSLSAITLSSNISKELHTQINVKDIFEYQTIKDLSNYISTLSGIENVNTIKKAEKQEHYPLSSAQKRMYYFYSMANNSTLYNIAGGAIVDKILDVNKLQKCFNTLINKHEALRTHFDIVNNEIVQIVDNNIDFKLNLDISNSDDLNKIYTDFVKPFDLSKAPLFRTKLVKLNENKMILLLDMHHIISDGTSLGILLQELCDLYNDKKLEENQIDYTDFTLWEKEQFNTDEFNKSKEYWVNQFKDEIPLLNMPTTYSRPSVHSFEGSNCYVDLPKDTFDRIQSSSKKLGITPYMLMLSCYYILLSKYTSQDNIVIGTPIVGRELPELSNMLGMFVNTLALRNKIDSKLSFNDFSNIIKNNCLDAFKNQSYPFDMLVKDLNINRDTSRNPLFDVMFIYQNKGYPEINFKDAKTEYFIPDNGVSKFDLSLEIIPVDNEYSLRFEYCTKLFNENFIKRLSSHYINILNTILENKEIKIADIDMLSEEEKNQILYEFNSTKVDYPKDKTIIDLFEEQVEKTPDNIAVVFENQKLTYKELNEKANQLAHYLKKQKIKKNDIVSIMVNRSLETIIAMFAVLKSGAGYMLIDPSLPAERINYMLEDSSSPLFITDKSIQYLNIANILYIDDFDYTNYSNLNINTEYAPSDSFCIIYTSGSTGKPKGVVLKNQSVCNLLLSYKHMLNTDICNNFLSISTVSFDMFIVETFIPILSGKTMFLTNNDEQKLPNDMSNLIIKENIDFILTTPSRIELLLQSNLTSLCLKNVKIIQLGGEVLTSKTLCALKENTSAIIYNGYGPSEATACCSNKKVTCFDDISIGKPFCNTQIYILNTSHQLCPKNVIGEICVAGDGLSKGYINNPIATEKSFIKNPLGHGLIYKTGDLGYYNENNEISFVGRNDNQIKIRGLRIELSEIENKMLSIPNINNCVVLYNKDNNDSYLTAFYTSKNELTISDIRSSLSKSLPLYMIPRYFIHLSELPVTSNGKIDRKSLSNYKKDFIEDSYCAPQNEIQSIFCKAWEDLLNKRVGIDDNVFEIGADSLSAIKFKTYLFEKNIDINYSDIFAYPTVRSLSNITRNNAEVVDYSYLNTLLLNHTNKTDIIHSSANNVLLLGATGFVGIHIINDFIENDTGNIYCIVRRKSNISSIDRFLQISHFYFGNKLDKYINKRIFIIEGNLFDSDLGLDKVVFKHIISNISCVINSAALVKHYGNYDEFKKNNIDIIENLINFCIKHHKRLLHISTMSISENINIDNTMSSHTSFFNDIFDEDTIYIGQKLNNIYIKSKFEAEKLIIENLSNGLHAQILRLGNMTNRYSDGMFQINPNSNTFANHIFAFATLKCIPEYINNIPIEFTPVDYCSKAIVKILQNNESGTVIYHLYNPNTILVKDLVEIINSQDILIKSVSHDNFVTTFYNYLSNLNRKDCVEMLISDLDENKKFNFLSSISLSSSRTQNFLNSVRFNWPEINSLYLKKYIDYFKQINLL